MIYQNLSTPEINFFSDKNLVSQNFCIKFLKKIHSIVRISQTNENKRSKTHEIHYFTQIAVPKQFFFQLLIRLVLEGLYCVELGKIQFLMIKTNFDKLKTTNLTAYNNLLAFYLIMKV